MSSTDNLNLKGPVRHAGKSLRGLTFGPEDVNDTVAPFQAFPGKCLLRLLCVCGEFNGLLEAGLCLNAIFLFSLCSESTRSLPRLRTRLFRLRSEPPRHTFIYVIGS